MASTRPGMRDVRQVEIVPAGECALVVRMGDTIDAATHEQVLALLAALDADPLAGVRDVVPAYASLTIHYDPLTLSREAIEQAVAARLRSHEREQPRGSGRIVRIPVTYGGADGPDLEGVAHHTGLSADEVVRRHAAATYRVYFLGFMAGFPYLGGLPSELATPRLTSPRPRVPAGSIGIAGQQTGIYTRESPGGWRLIGRTAARLFDAAQHPPALLQPGDLVRFDPVPAEASSALAPPDEAPAAEEAASVQAPPEATSSETASLEDSAPWVRVHRAGWLTTVQDLGRPAFARYGVSWCGAADRDALRLGNMLLGNQAGAAALEVAMGGAELEILAPCVVALTGADCAARAGGRPMRAGMVALLQAGDVLELDTPRAGMRSYVCVAGGVWVPAVLGSRSTDVRAGLGGLDGRALRPGDTLERGTSAAAWSALAGRRLPADPAREVPANGTWRLRVLPGPHAARAPDALQRLVAGQYTVDAHSDRIGVRLRWMESEESQTGQQAARPAGGETLTEGVPRGAVQVPGGGEPILLLADHQTTGGYRIPAVVIAADWWRVAQMRPGETVTFELVSHEQAIEALRAREAWLRDLERRWQREGTGAGAGGLDAEALARGFSEWSEGADDGD